MKKPMKLDEAFRLALGCTRGCVFPTDQERTEAADKLEKFLKDMGYGVSFRKWTR